MGRSFSKADEADKIMRSSGGMLTYDILRDGKEFSVEVQLVSFGISYQVLQTLLLSLIYLVFGLIIIVKRPELIAARMVSIMMIVLGIVILTSYQQERVFERDILLESMSYIKSLFLILIPSIYFHSGVYFPKERIELIKKKKFIWILYAICMFGWISSTVLSYMGNDLLSGQIVVLVMLLSIAYIIVVNNIVLRKQTGVEYKRLSRVVRWSYFIIVVTMLGMSYLYYSIVLNSGTNISEAELLIMKLDAYRQFFLLLIPLAYLYTIGRYKLLDMEVRIRRNIQYMITSTVWKIGLAGVIVSALYGVSQYDYTVPNIKLTGSSIEVLKNPLREDLQEDYRSIILVLISIVSVILFVGVLRHGQRFLDKKFYRASLDYKKISHDLSQIILRNAGVDDLSKKIVSELMELIPFKSLGIMFFKGEKKVYGQEYVGFKSDSLKEYCELAGENLISAIKEFHGEFRVDYLPEIMRGIFSKCGFIYVIPIYSKKNLVGALFLGEKLSEIAFRREDMEFLTSVAGQASIAIENAFLYEDLTHQERIKHELDLARKIQLASLPQEVPEIKGIDISGLSLPAYEVGGDFYDYLYESNDKILIVVGDVSGKGTSAALYMAKAQGIMRTLFEFKLSPRDLFIKLNQLLYRYLEKSSFITAIGALIDVESKKLTLARAGHVPMYYYNIEEQKIDLCKPKGIVLGMSSRELFSANLDEEKIDF